jgi:hypothetical protein
MKKLLLLLLLLPALAFAQDIEYETYDECILDRLAGISSDIAAQAIIQSCENKYSPESINMIVEDEQAMEEEIISKPSEQFVEVIEDGVVQSEVTDTYTYPDGSVYTGEFKNGKRNGQGTYTDSWHIGDSIISIVYTGAFLDGQYHGQGNFTRSEDNEVIEVYTGEFKKGMRNGQGTYTSYGDVFVGEWEDEAAVQGTYTYTDGSIYIGAFESGRYHGQGSYTLYNGSVYMGDFINGVMHGQGVYSSIDGYTYNGRWFYNKASGHGVYNDKQGAVYIGGWKKGLRHGQGIYTSPEKEIKNGIWENNNFLTSNAK